MWRSVFLCIAVMVSNKILLAQFPSLDSYSVGSIASIIFSYDGGSKSNTEVPPWIIPGGSRSYFFVDGSDTYIWSTPASLITNNSINLNDADGPHHVSQSYINSSGYSPENNIWNWKRNYHGVYSALYFNHPVEGTVSLGFLHGENKNFVSGDPAFRLAPRYKNTIQPNTPIDPANPQSYSGGNPFHEGWEAYNGIISAAWIPNTKKTSWGQDFFQNELGPIAWPATGYITRTGVKCTSGLRHPSSLISGNYIYVFYVEGGPYGNNIACEEGRLGGIKVIRATLKDALDPRGYRVYYREKNGNETWSSSLPEGFTKENMLNFVAVRGPKAADILQGNESNSQEIRFTVARVSNSDYFLGVEQYIDLKDSKKYKVALRFSKDLVHWSERSLIVYQASDWQTSRMNYPIFLNKDGWSNTEVDLDDFYILGCGGSPANFVNKIHIQAAPAVLTSGFSMRSSYASSPMVTDALFPNPNMGVFKLAYTLSRSSEVAITVFDMSGRKLKFQSNGPKKPGQYVEDLDISAWPGGAYLVELLENNSPHLYKVIKK